MKVKATQAAISSPATTAFTLRSRPTDRGWGVASFILTRYITLVSCNGSTLVNQILG